MDIRITIDGEEYELKKMTPKRPNLTIGMEVIIPWSISGKAKGIVVQTEVVLRILVKEGEKVTTMCVPADKLDEIVITGRFYNIANLFTWLDDLYVV